jgi:hypothetical protein
MATVYVLGAGASKHIGYPLASEMGDGLFDRMLSDEGAHASARYLIDRFGRKGDFEDLVTEIQRLTSALKGSPDVQDRAERSRLGTSSGQMIHSLQHWFREIRLRPAPLYADFASRIVRAGDTVVTFNYDDSLE